MDNAWFCYTVLLVVLRQIIEASDLSSDSCYPGYMSSNFWTLCGGCGLCQNKYYRSSKWYCDYSEFSNIFTAESEGSCDIADICIQDKSSSDHCKNLPCVSMFGTFKCQCNNVKYGRLCEHEISRGVQYEEIPVVDYLLYTPFFVLNGHITISVFFSNLGKELKIIVETLIERLVYDSNICREFHSSLIHQYCTEYYPNLKKICLDSSPKLGKVKWVITIRIPFPGREFTDPQRKYVRKGRDPRYRSFFMGMKESLNLFIYQNNESFPVFDTNVVAINLFESPAFSFCEPFVLITEGSETLYNIVKFSRRTEIILSGIYKMVEDICLKHNQDLNIKWRLWKYGINHQEVGGDFLIEKFNVESLVFKPFSLAFGQYKARSNVTLWESYQEGFSVAYSYFEVVEVELEAIIQGGDTRKVYYKINELVLNGSLSKNPNLNIADQAQDLLFFWEYEMDGVNIHKGVYSNKNHAIFQGPFVVGKTYTFLLTIKSQMYNRYKKVIQEIIIVSDKIPTLEILCRKNCYGSNFESNPLEHLYLEVVITDWPPGLTINNDFTWTYKVVNEENSKPVDEIARSNTPSDVLIVLGNTLTQGQNYTFTVQGGSNVPGFATFRILMATAPKPFSCTLRSTVVDRGKFGNEIKCDKILLDNLTPTYEYYDRFPDSDQKGRLLGRKKANFFKYVAFTRGQLVVQVSNRQGLIRATKVDLTIEDPEEFVQAVKSLLDDFKQNQLSTDSDFKANSLSVMVDMIVYKREDFPELSSLIGSLLAAASSEKISSYSSIKIWLFALEVLAIRGGDFGLSSTSLKHLSQILEELSSNLHQLLSASPDLLEDFTTSEIIQVSEAVIIICNFLYTGIHDETFSKTFEEHIYTVHSNCIETTYNFVMSIESIESILGMSLLPFMMPIVVRGPNITMWIKEDLPRYFHQASTHQIKNESILGVEISQELSKYLTTLAKTIVLEIIVFDRNPYSWNKNVKISTNVIDVQIRKPKVDGGEFISKLPEPITVVLDLYDDTEMILNGTVQQPDPDQSPEITDQQVSIHKIRTERGGQLKITFLNLNQSETLQVIVFRNLRPDYENIMNMGDIITHSSPVYVKQLVDPTSEDIYDLYYFGILPGQHLPVGQWMNYSFDLEIIHCVSWHFEGWRTKGCKAKGVSVETKKLYCDCTHLSIFGGYLNFPVNTVNPFEDYKLLVHVFDNPFVAVFIACALLIYFILLFWAVRKDWNDKIKQCAIYLEDNLPYDKFPYLVAVYTGARLFAGTTSNVGVIIQGEDGLSRPHILESKRFRTLQRAEDNWFILFTPNSLGKIKLLQIWTDYSGNRPEWYCNKIVVIDVTESRQYTFLVNSWISLRFGEHIERFVKVDSIENKKKRDLTSDSLIFGFRDGHLWFSVLTNHPRSALRTSHRLSVAFCGFFVSLLVSCMFFGVIKNTVEDKPQFKITIEQMIVGICCVLLSTIIVGISLSIFRKSATLQDREDHPYEEDKPVKKKFGIFKRIKLLESEKRHGAFLTRFSKAIVKIVMKKRTFVPVHLDIDVIHIEKKKSCKRISWVIISWFICVTVILLCSYFVILYGLKFGRVKSLEWLSSAVFGLGEGIFLASPTKIIFLAVLSGMTFTQEYEIVKYDINWKMLRLYKRYLFTHRLSDMGKELLGARSKKKYVPLNCEGRKKKIERQSKLDAMWLLLDILIIGILAVMLNMQSNTLWTTKYFWENNQLHYLLKTVYKEEGFKTKEMQNISVYLPFLKDNVFPLIYQSQWYNGRLFETINDTLGNAIKYTFSGTSTLFGLPRLTQARLKPNLCKENLFVGLPDYCLSVLTRDTVDDDVYKEGWTSMGSFASFMKSSPWSYQQSEEDCNTIAFNYPSLKHDCGGYIVDLGLSQTLSEEKVMYLKETDWIDKRTSVVLFDLTLYNVNTGTLSWLMSITERMFIGLLINKLFVFTINQAYQFQIIDVILLFSLCTFILRVLLFVNRRGVVHAMTDFWTLLEIVIVWLSIYCAVAYVKSINLTLNHVEDFQNRSNEKHFQFLPLLPYLIAVRTYMIVLVVMLACRFMKSWKFGRIFDVFFFTLIRAWQSLMWILMILIVIIFSYWKAISFHVNNFMVLRPTGSSILLHKSDFKLTVKNCVTYNCKISPFMLSVVSLVLTQFIITHYLTDFRVTKNKRSKHVPNILTTLFRYKQINV